jgi:glycerol kinase
LHNNDDLFNMKHYILAIDQGTTGSTSIICNDRGKEVAKASHEIQQIFPQPGWVEHNPEEYITNSLTVMKEAVASAGISWPEISGIGITNQRETTIVWDRDTGKPVYNAIVWQCRRTAPLCEELKQKGYGPLIKEKTGLPIDAYFSATKVRWILDNVPDGQNKAENGKLLFGTVDTWLIWNLTGGKLHITDYSNASRTMLYNINTLRWDDEILSILNIPKTMLPEVIPSSKVYGETKAGLLADISIPLASIAGDQQAALFGEACFQPGMAKNTYGTGSFVMLNTGNKPVYSDRGLVTTIAWGLENKIVYALEGSIFITGAAIQWLRDGLKIISTAAETESLANSIYSNEGVYFVPAFVGLGAPYWDMYARGTILGLTRGTTAAHIARAALEAIAYQARDVLEAMEADANLKVPVLRVDGGGTANKFLLQFQSDILGMPLQRTSTGDITALGTAYLAGLATGIWKDVIELSNGWTAEETYQPYMPAVQRNELYEKWQKAVQRSRNWATD